MALDNELEVRISGKNNLGPALNNATRDVQRFAQSTQSQFNAMARNVVGSLGGIIASGLAMKAVFAGIANADFLRDLAAGVNAVSTSTAQATKALEFFEKAQKQTRSTGDELAKFYRDTLPIAMRKGFSEDTYQKVVVQLDQFATAVGRTASEVQDAWGQLLAGRVRGTNPILMALGISVKDVQEGKVNMREILDGVEKLAAKGEAMGDSFASAKAKISDALLDAFAGGFNDARGAATKGMQGITEALTSPEFLDAVRAVGKAVATIVPAIAKGITFAIGSIQTAVGLIEMTIGKFYGLFFAMLSEKAQGLADLLGNIAGFIQQHPNVANLLGINVSAAGGLNKIAGFLHGASGQFADWKAGADALVDHGADVAASGAEKVLKVSGEALRAMGLDKLLKALGIDIPKASKESSEAIDHLNLSTKGAKDQFASLGKVAAAFKMPAWLQNFTAQLSVNPSINARTLENARNNVTGAMLGNTQVLVNDEIHQRTLRMAIEKYAAQVYAQELADKWRNVIGPAAGDMLADFAQTGGRNFGQIAAQTFSRLVTQGADTITGVLLARVAGLKKGSSASNQDPTAYYDKNGNRVDDVAGYASGTSGGRAMQYGMAGLQIAGGAYQMGRSGQNGSITAGVASGAMAGLTFGGWGAVIGAIVGGIAAAAGKAAARGDYKYAAPGINEGGQAYAYSWKNITPADQKAYLRRIQETFDTFWNGYVNILLKFPEAVIPKLQAIGGKFQEQASSHFLDNFESWIKGTLPDAIAKQFQDGMAITYAKMGMSVDRFKQIWDKLGQLDPQKKMELLGMLADTLIDFTKAAAFFAWNTKATGRQRPIQRGEWATGAMGDIRNQTFLGDLSEGDAKIAQLANHLKDLTGEAQINSARQLSQLVTERMEKEKQYLTQLVQLADTISQSFDGAIRGLKAQGILKPDGTADFEGQANYWRDYANDILKQLQTATNPAEVQRLQQEYMNAINEILNLGKQMGPEAFEKYRQWAIEAFEIGKKLFLDKITAMGDAVAQANAELWEKIKGDWANFTNILDTAGDDVGGAGNRLGGAIDLVGQRLRDLAEAMDGAIDRINSAGGNATVPSSSMTAQSISASSQSYERGVIARRLGR